MTDSPSPKTPEIPGRFGSFVTRNVIANHNLIEVVRSSSWVFEQGEEAQDLRRAEETRAVELGRDKITRLILHRASQAPLSAPVHARASADNALPEGMAGAVIAGGIGMPGSGVPAGKSAPGMLALGMPPGRDGIAPPFGPRDAAPGVGEAPSTCPVQPSARVAPSAAVSLCRPTGSPGGGLVENRLATGAVFFCAASA